MSAVLRVLSLAMLAVMLVAPNRAAADLDRTAVDFTPPSEIKWVRNAAGTNEQAVLFGDPATSTPTEKR